MATKDPQINVRLPRDLDAWLGKRAGGNRKKPAYIRALLERERAREQETELQDMFDHAWDSLTEDEREAVRGEREEWIGANAGNKQP